MSRIPQRFLVIRLSSIGDIVHALPAVAALGETFPDAEIHWVVETRYAALLDGNPFVHRLIKLDTLGWRRHLTSPRTVEEIIRGLGALRRFPYDSAIDFQGLYKSALITWLSRARERVGFAERRLREPAAGVFYTERVSAPGREHVVELNFALVERLGVRRLEPPRWQFPLPRSEAVEREVENRLATLGAGDFIVTNPGGGWMSKRWPPECYAELIRDLEAELPLAVLLTGSPDEEEMIREILQKSGARRAMYVPTTLVEFVALVRRAKLFVGGDTGPLHLAAAVRTPIVAIYGPTDPARNGPFSSADITLWNRGPIDYTRRTNRPAYLPGIPVSAVLAAVRGRLKGAHG